MIGVAASGGLPAGVGAIVALLLLIYGADAPLWVAIPLAVGTYVGVALLRNDEPGYARMSAPMDDCFAPFVAAVDHVARLHELKSRIAKHTVREQIGRIAAGAERVVQASREDENAAAARLFVEQVLAPVVSLVTEYVRLTSRGVTSATGAIERTETRDLPLIEQAIGDIYERLNRSHLVDLATTGELLELNLEHIANAIARRGRT